MKTEQGRAGYFGGVVKNAALILRLLANEAGSAGVASVAHHGASPQRDRRLLCKLTNGRRVKFTSPMKACRIRRAWLVADPCQRAAGRMATEEAAVA